MQFTGSRALRGALVVLVVTATGLALAACGSGSGSSATPQSPGASPSVSAGPASQAGAATTQPATAPTPAATDSALHVWTAAQRDAFIAAYDADLPALRNMALACLLATVQPKEDGDSAVH